MKKKYTYLIIIFLIVASFIAYGRILSNGLINFDDDKYITENNHIKSGINQENIKWAFGTVVSANWHPLTLLSHMLDWSLFGANASGHHLINLLLHIGNALLLFFFFNRMTKNLWSSAFVAALFALHPLRVESVAWAAERKDVLSMFFGLASFYAYACYVENSKFSKYFLCLILFALSLMAKPILVTLPFVLLLLDYWPLGRWQRALQKELSTPVKSRDYSISRLFWEKAPFLLLTIVSSIVTLWAQNKGGTIASMEGASFLTRIMNAITSYVSYLVKTFWPVNLAVFYPYQFSFPFWQILTSCFILIGITIVVIYAIKKLPFLFVGWFWYLGTLIPVIGLVQVASQAMADRYTYLPSIGIAIMLAWGIPLFLFQKLEIRKKILFSVAIAFLCMFAVSTWMQCGYWKNSLTLFNHALQVTKDNYMAHNNFGLALFAEGKIKEAIEHYNKAIYLNPGHAAEFYTNRGIAYANLGQHQRSIEDYNEAIRLKPDLVAACNNRGFAYSMFGQYQRAIKDLNKAILLQPDNALAYKNRGSVYLSQGNNELGCRDAQMACALGHCELLEGAKGRGYGL